LGLIRLLGSSEGNERGCGSPIVCVACAFAGRAEAVGRVVVLVVFRQACSPGAETRRLSLIPLAGISGRWRGRIGSGHPARHHAHGAATGQRGIRSIPGTHPAPEPRTAERRPAEKFGWRLRAVRVRLLAGGNVPSVPRFPQVPQVFSTFLKARSVTFAVRFSSCRRGLRGL